MNGVLDDDRIPPRKHFPVRRVHVLTSKAHNSNIRKKGPATVATSIVSSEIIHHDFYEDIGEYTQGMTFFSVRQCIFTEDREGCTSPCQSSPSHINSIRSLNIRIEAAILYPGLRPTVLRMRLRLRGTTVGANNRLDLVSLVTSGVSENEISLVHEEDVLETTQGWQEDETHNPHVPAVSHRRGLAPLVFVPFEEVDTSDLNLPVDKMDYFVPG